MKKNITALALRVGLLTPPLSGRNRHSMLLLFLYYMDGNGSHKII